MKTIRDNTDGSTFPAIDFGGPDIYQVNGVWVYAPAGGTSITETATEATLNPLGIIIPKPGDYWEVISHQNIGTCNWRVTVQHTTTGEIKTGVYPFNLNGQVYQLECGGNEWVMASCGGYEIVDEGGIGDLCYTLTGTGEKIYADLNTSQLYVQAGYANWTTPSVSTGYPSFNRSFGFATAIGWTGTVSPNSNQTTTPIFINSHLTNRYPFATGVRNDGWCDSTNEIEEGFPSILAILDNPVLTINGLVLIRLNKNITYWSSNNHRSICAFSYKVLGYDYFANPLH